MNSLFIRLTISILSVIGLNLIGLAYFIGETLLDELSVKGKYYITISFIMSFILLSFIIYNLVRKAMKPINQVTDLIKDLNDGHYWRRINSQEADQALQELTEYTNELASQLQKATENQLINENRLQTLFRHMASGLMFINHIGRISITNQKVLDMLNWKESHSGSLYYDVPFPEEMVEMIRDTFIEEQEMKRHITIEKGIYRTVLDLSVAPVKDLEDQTRGIVLVFHDITDLKKLEQMRADFVANVSHELKTPLTSIKGFSETLLEGAMYSEEHLHQFLNIIHKEADRLHRLIQDLLHLSHIEQNNFELNWGEVDLNEVIHNVLLLVKNKAEEKSIKIKYERKENHPYKIEGDKDRILQMMLNLVSNAIQYTPEQGEVDIDVQPWTDKGYVFCVRDNGVGIKKEEIPRVFERFYRVDKARSRSSGGTGLGLAIVKHLVEAHHGQISVSSEEGKGSQFCIYFHKQKHIE